VAARSLSILTVESLPRPQWILSETEPMWLLKNPVIFVTEVGAALVSIEILFGSENEAFGFVLQIALWLWFTVLFATLQRPWPKVGARPGKALRKTRHRDHGKPGQG